MNTFHKENLVLLKTKVLGCFCVKYFLSTLLVDNSENNPRKIIYTHTFQ